MRAKKKKVLYFYEAAVFSPHLFSAFTRLSVGEIMRRHSAGPTTACLAPN